MASAHRRSRKQFRTPLTWGGVPTPGGPLPRRVASCPEAPPEGRARRGHLLHTGESPPPPVAGGLFRRRLARAPQPGPWPGGARRGRLAGEGKTAIPLVVPTLLARCPGPPFQALLGRARRGAIVHSGASVVPVTAPNRFRLPAGRATSFRLPASRAATFRLTASQAMSVASHIEFFRGEDVVLDFELTPVIDCTGWAITLKVADTLGGSVQLTKTATITDGPRGRFRVTIASADTASLSAGRYTWDCRRTDSGAKATLAHGELDLRREVVS